MNGANFAVITGGNCGLGLQLAKALYKNGGFSIVLACRSKVKAENAVQSILATTAGNPEKLHSQVQYLQLDLTERDSVKEFISAFSNICPRGSLKLLVNNAGIMGHPYHLTDEGVEIHFASNHLGHFQLTNMLIEFMAQEARIVNVTSSYYERCLHIPSIEILSGKEKSAETAPNDFYSISKLANCLHVVALDDRLPKLGHPGIKTVAVRPGFVRGTDLGRHTNVILRWLAAPLIWMVAKNLEEGTSTMLHCSTCDHKELVSGKLYYEKKVIEFKETVTLENANALWDLSESLCSTVPNVK